jgi:hypothetical protein
MVKDATKAAARATAKKGLTAKGTLRKRLPRQGEGGQRRHAPTRASRATVISMRSEASTLVEIAKALNTTRDSIRRYYPSEITLGDEMRLEAIEMKLHKAALAGQIAPMIFVSKAKLNYVEASTDSLKPPPTRAPDVHVTFTPAPHRNAAGEIVEDGAVMSLIEWQARHLYGRATRQH